MALPNLFVIGAMKSGTTSLHSYLDAHPEIFMSKVKEIDYFIKERNYDKGLAWYEAQFDGRYPWRGESSQNYTKRHMFQPSVPERVAAVSPDARLVYIVRDPIKRIVSHYHEAVEGGYRPKEGLNAFLAADIAKNHYVLTSSYGYQIEPWLRCFGRDSVYVMALECLQDNALGEMNKLYRWLGLPEVSSEKAFAVPLNTRDDKKMPTWLASYSRSKHSSWVRKVLPGFVKQRLKSKDGLAVRLFTKPMVHESLDDGVANRLRSVLASDIEQFRELTGMEFKTWCV